jgi:murein DD-endopeptidase MepM/ murein hydrolase activator NlpD
MFFRGADVHSAAEETGREDGARPYRRRMVVRAVAALVFALLCLRGVAGAAEPAAIAPPVDGGVVRLFDPPEHPYGSGHRGVDLTAAAGDEVHVAMPGLVTFAGEVAGVGWVTVDHGGGLATTYGPLDPRRVRAGERVGAGQLLGLVADDASHLDWGARRNGVYIDPLSLLVRWQVHLAHPDAEVPDLSSLLVGVPAAARRLRMPAAGPVTSGFGQRLHPITGEYRLHAGLDIAAPSGAPVVAPADGVVAIAGEVGGYGLLVSIDHGGGLETRMAHLSRIDVAAGARVAAGDSVGAVGSTGLSTGPHLHFEVRAGGVAHDPARWLPL